MSFWETPGGAATISAGASVLDSAFGGDDGPNYGKMRKHSKKMYRIQREQYGPDMKARVDAARGAGLHPLFALGSGQSFSGGTIPTPPPGQSSRGSGVSDAVQAALSAYQGTQLHRAQIDLVDAQADLSRARALEQVTSNDNADLIVPGQDSKYYGPINPAQEKEPGKVQAHDPKHREQNQNVLSPMSKFRVGSQDVWLPIEEMDQLTEDPAAVIAMAATYHGNKGVDWPLMLQEYRHGTAMTRRQATGATKKAFVRMQKRKREKARRPYSSNQFYSYSRGPHR